MEYAAEPHQPFLTYIGRERGCRLCNEGVTGDQHISREQFPDAVGTAGLFIADECQVRGEFILFIDHLPARGKDRGTSPLHVGASPSPDLPVLDRSGKRIMPP